MPPEIPRSAPHSASAEREIDELDRSPIVLKVDDLGTLELLTKKVKAYTQRRDNKTFTNPRQNLENEYKIAIIQTLIIDGSSFDLENPSERIRGVALSDAITSNEHGIIDAEMLESAFDVIKDYVKTGGRNNEQPQFKK